MPTFGFDATWTDKTDQQFFFLFFPILSFFRSHARPQTHEKDYEKKVGWSCCTNKSNMTM